MKKVAQIYILQLKNDINSINTCVYSYMYIYRMERKNKCTLGGGMTGENTLDRRQDYGHRKAHKGSKC